MQSDVQRVKSKFTLHTYSSKRAFSMFVVIESSLLCAGIGESVALKKGGQ